MAGHIHDHVHIDVKLVRRINIDAELVVRPSPNKLPEVVENKQEPKDDDEDGKEPARLRTGLVGGGKLGEGVELGERGGDEVVELVEDGVLVGV